MPWMCCRVSLLEGGVLMEEEVRAVKGKVAVYFIGSNPGEFFDLQYILSARTLSK